MEKLGPYLIDGELGRGGMGVVWRARDSRTGRSVALKTIALSLFGADRSVLERFRREAGAAKRVTHPNIAGLLDLGEDRGVAYIAFELVEGESLDRVLRERGPLPWQEAVGLAAQIARALAAVHGAGLIHRDVKPANVLLAPGGTAKLADFGLVRAIGSKDSLAGSLTQEGHVVGTPQYFAPEQLETSKKVGPAADLYALGGTLSTLLTGQAPFTGHPLELMRKHLMVPPPVPGESVKGIPPALDRLVVRLMAKDPKARGASASAVAEELESLGGGKPSASRAPLFVLLLLLVIVLVLGLFAVLREKPPAPPPGPASGAPRPVATPRGVPGPLIPSGQLGPSGPWRHSGPIDAIVALPDNESLIEAAGQHEKSIRRWNMKTGKEVWTQRVGEELCDEACSLAVSEDGARLLAGSRNGSLRVFDASTGERIGGPLAAAVSPPVAVVGVAYIESRVAIIAREDCKVEIWDTEERRLLKSALAGGPGGQVHALALTRELNLACTGGEGVDPMVWMLPALTPLDMPDRLSVGSIVRALVYSPSGQELVAAGDGGHLSIHRRLHAAPDFTEVFRGLRIEALAFLGAERIVDGRKDGSVHVWELPHETPGHRLASTKLEDHVSSIVGLSEDRFAAGTWGSSVHLFELRRDHLEEVAPTGGQRLACEKVAALSEEQAVASCWIPDLVVWDASKPDFERRKCGQARIKSVVAREGRIFTGDEAGQVKEWPATGGTPKLIAEHGDGNHVTALSVTREGPLRVASVAWFGPILVTNADTRERKTLVGPTIEGATSISLHPRGDLVAVACVRSTIAVHVRDSSGAERPRVLALPSDEVPAKEWRAFASFSPDGEVLIAAAAHGPVESWDTKTWERTTWLGERRWVVTAEWLDAKHVVLTDWLGEIACYERGASTPYHTVSLREEFDFAVSLSVYGDKLFAGTARGGLRRFDIRPR